MIPIKREQRVVKTGVTVIVLLLLIGCATALGVLPDKPVSNYEIRLFGVLFLLFIFLVVVMMAMIRNAIVANTSFILKLRDAQMSNTKSNEKLEKSQSDLNKTNQTANKVMGNLAKEIARINDAQIPE